MPQAPAVTDRPLVVVGEALLDIDLVGESTRLCPDAPVPVVDERQELARPGGAALAALLAARGGRPVVLVTPLADDAAADQLIGRLEPAVRVLALPATGGTPVKRRVRAGGQSLVRLDRGGGAAPLDQAPDAVTEVLEQCAGVLVSDYGRGLTHQPGARRVLQAAAHRVPLVWDPHPLGGPPVPGTLLVTPNEHEVGAADGADLVAAALDLVARWEVPTLCVTRGGRGAVLVCADGTTEQLDVAEVSGTDTCGAGDQLAAAAAGALAAGAEAGAAARAGVRAAARYVADGGAAALARPVVAAPSRRAPTTPNQVAASATPDEVVALARRTQRRGGTVVATGGCFDLLHAGHVATLRAARAQGSCLVVCLNSDASVRRLKGPDRPVVPEADRAAVLSALGCVDGVLVFGEDTPFEVLERLRPDVWVKGGDYAAGMLPEDEVLARWSGRSVVVPYLPGRSTSGLVARTRTATHV